MWKKHIVWIGKKRHCKDELDITKDLVWGNQTFNLLGVKYSINLETMIKINYDPLLQNIDNCLNSWKKKHFTPLGKITVLKTFMLSKLIHLFTALPNPDQTTIVKLQRIFLNFIWDQKPDRISRKTICKEYMVGGFIMNSLWYRKIALETTNVFWRDTILAWGRDGVYYILSITITITLQSITITFQIFKSITITITLPYLKLKALNCYYT